MDLIASPSAGFCPEFPFFFCCPGVVWDASQHAASWVIGFWVTLFGLALSSMMSLVEVLEISGGIGGVAKWRHGDMVDFPIVFSDWLMLCGNKKYVEMGVSL